MFATNLDLVFHSLSDPIRRDILDRVAHGELSVTELVIHYNISFPAISKHLKVLAAAKLITKRKDGQKHMISLAPSTLASADEYLERYRQMWQSRHDILAALVEAESQYGKN